MSALIFPTDCKVGYKNSTEATWHGYDVELPEGVMPTEATRFVGADYPVTVMQASAAVEQGSEPASEALSLAGPSIFLVTTPMPAMDTDPEAPQAPDDYDPREMPSFSGDTLVLGVCSQDYRVIENMEIAEVADRFVVAADEYLRGEQAATQNPSIKLALPAVNSVGTLRGRRVFFLSLLLGGFGLAFKALPTVNVDLGSSEAEKARSYEETGFEDFPYKVLVPFMKLSAADGEESEVVDVELHFSADEEAGLTYRVVAVLDGGDEEEEGTLLDEGKIERDLDNDPQWVLYPWDVEDDEPAPFTVESYQEMDEAVTAALREILGLGKTGDEKKAGPAPLPVWEIDLPELTRNDGTILSGAVLTFDAESYTIRQGEVIIDSGRIDINVALNPAVTLCPYRADGDLTGTDMFSDESYGRLDKIVDETLRKKEETAPKSTDLNEEGDGGSGLDDIEARLLFVSSHDGSRPLSVKVVFTRVVCNNTLTAAELDPKVARLFVIKHLGDTKAKLESMAGAMEYLVRTTSDFKRRLEDYSSFLLDDSEADILAGYFFGFSWKLTWLREAASRLWRGEGLLGAESIQAPSLYRLYNVVTQILSHEQQGGADADEAEQAGAAFSSGILDRYKGNRSPTEAAAYMAHIYSSKDKVLEEARQAAQVAAQKNEEGVKKMSAAKAGKEV